MLDNLLHRLLSGPKRTGLALAVLLSLAGCDSSPPAPATPPAGSGGHGGPPGVASHGGPADAGDATDDTGEFAAGKKIFRAQCARCHSVSVQMAGEPGPGGPGGPPGGPGSGGPGGPPGGPRSRGPNLSKVGADPDHTVEWLTQYIRNPKSVKENSKMPPQKNISGDDLQAVAEYLASLK